MSDDFPTTPGAVQPTFAGDADAFVTKLDPTGTALVYSTYLGSGGQEWADDVAIDARGNAYVIGTTRSTDFPTTPGAFQPAPGGGPYDAFVAKLEPAGGALVYSTYVGGSNADAVAAVTVDASENAYVTGFTNSRNFPITAEAFQPMFRGDRDVFVAKISHADPPVPATVGKVTGAGSVRTGGGVGTFDFVVRRKAPDGPIRGNLHYFNHATRVRLRAVSFTALSIAGDTATFEGTCMIKASRCTFAVTVTAERKPARDTFLISISGAAPEGGVVRGGNIRIRQ
jgi:hypothetical protein